MLLKLNCKLRKMFLSFRGCVFDSRLGLRNIFFSETFRSEALTIELPGLRWQRKGYDVYWFVRATYVLLIQQSRYVCIYILLTDNIWNDLQFGYLKVNYSLLKLYDKLRKMFLSPRDEKVSRLRLRNIFLSLRLSWNSKQQAASHFIYKLEIRVRNNASPVSRII